MSQNQRNPVKMLESEGRPDPAVADRIVQLMTQRGTGHEEDSRQLSSIDERPQRRVTRLSEARAARTRGP
jgi:hypothetical protein